MRILRKMFFLSVIITLISSSFPFPNQIVTAEQVDEESSASERETATIVIDEDNEQNDDVEVYLFETDSVESDVLTILDNETTLTVINQEDLFSLVEVIDEDENIITGYVLNEFIEFVEQKIELEDEPEDETEEQLAEEDQATSNEEEQTIDEDTEEVEDQERKDNESSDEEQDSVNVSLTSLNDTTLSGIALKNKTHVYSEQSQSSEPLKSYAPGTTLKYYELNNDWYAARVKVNGEWKTGYIFKDDIENLTGNIVSLRGIALKDKTNVYEETSRDSSVLRDYSIGTILQYKTFSSDWYTARVKSDGQWKTGYIHKNDVENVIGEQVAKQGIALNDKTNIYSKATKQSKALKSYREGSVLKYQTFSSDWYVARVKANGKWTTGYIHKNDVDNTYDIQESLSGIGLKQPTHIYSRASRSASSYKTYEQGTVLKYKSLSKNWHEATVYVNGIRRTGYIHTNDVEQAVDKQERLDSWALRTPTNVYSKASRNAKIIRNDYKKGQKLKVKTLSKNWYEANVKYKGVWTKGYINAADISPVFATYTDYDLTLDDAVNIQLSGAPQTDNKQAWVSKSYIKNNKVTANELNVRLGPGTTYKSVDKIKKDTRVKILDEYNGWYVIEFDHNSQWTHAGPKDILKYLNPQNYVNDDRQKFQFLDLSKPSGASASVLNKYLNGKGTLSGQGKAFIDASKKLDINDIYLISHAVLETGHGQSDLAQGFKVGLDKNDKPQIVTERNEKDLTNIKTVYNMFGIRAFDSCPDACGAAYAYTEGWDTPYKAIIGGAEFISSDYIQGQNSEGTVLNTLYKMRWNPEFAANNDRYGKQYATDIGWAVKQVNMMYNLYEEIGTNQLVLDIPVYKIK